MNIEDLFKGKIKVSCTGKRAKSKLDFSFTTTDFTIDQVVMANFDDLNFSNDEKRNLSAKYRQIIKQYQNLNPKELKKFSKDLMKMINQLDSDEITIEACDAGAFICLNTIFSGKLPKNKDIYFNLQSVPLKLFPQSLISDSKAINGVSVCLKNPSTSWMREVKSLEKSPKHINIKTEAPCLEELMFG